jgi:oxygen-independent coproporphyrinogen-3 oxidase
VATLRRAGVPALNLDLIYGGPGEDAGSWAATLERGGRPRPEHLSAYALTIEPATKFGRLVAAGRMAEPGEDDLADRYDSRLRRPGRAGYAHYEVSNWARARGPTVRPRRRTTSPTGGGAGTWGSGAGAHEFDGTTRRWNLPGSRRTWRPSTAAARPPRARSALDAGQARFEALALRLRTVAGSARRGPGARVDPAGEEATPCAPPACWPRDRPAP